jgi:hypothetical protein
MKLDAPANPGEARLARLVGVAVADVLAKRNR